VKRIYYGWWILASSLVIMYLTGTVLFAFSAYYPSLIETFGWKRAELLFGNTIMQWAFGLMGLVWGAIADQRGVRGVLAAGTGCVAVACLLFGRITELWELYALALVFGAGLSGMGYLSNQILLSRWFASRRGSSLRSSALSARGRVRSRRGDESAGCFFVDFAVPTHFFRDERTPGAGQNASRPGV
jgi:sugar phosphate permease